MSTTIERQIVQMVFDAKEFRKKIQNSIRDISDFKKSFEFSGAQKSLADLEKSSEVDFSVMAEGIASINSKMSLMGVAAAQIISTITTSILDAGKKMVDALVLTPLTDGLGEYETQLNAIQTILANTSQAGTTLEDVTAALDELNDYADLTIYNFTQMVDSIGKFTTAGVDLETSTQAIKGIANVAALSGANAQQASTAMYQLSQAISSGVVRLQDWISVENAGMGGQLFRDSLVETARIHGVHIDAMLEKHGGFRFSLQEGWLSSEIMLETLQKFTGDLSEAQLQQMGYTDEQIVKIQELAQMALDSATKIKTLTALKDTLAEVLGSGWAQTWAIIFGDFEQAKELWGSLGDVFSGMIESSSDARNKLLGNWAWFGGRDIAITALFDIIKAGQNILEAFGEAIGDVFEPLSAWDLVNITKSIGDLALKIRMGTNDLGTFKSIVRGIAAALDIVRLVITAVAKPILAVLIPSVNLGSKGFFAWLGALGDTIVAFREFAIESGFFDIVISNIIAGAKSFIAEARRLVKAFLDLDVVGKAVEWFQLLVDLFNKIDWARTWQEIQNGIRYVIAPFYMLALGIQWLYKEVEKLQIIEKIVEWFQSVDWQAYADYFTNMSDSVKELFDSLKNSETLEKFVTLIKTFDGRRITQFVSDAKTAFAELGGVIGGVRTIFGVGGDGSNFIIDKLKDIGSGIIEGIKTVLDYLINNAENIDYEVVFDIINKALFGGLLLSLKNLIQGGLLGGLLGEDVTEGVADMFEGLGDTIGTFQNNIRADTLKKIATAIAILAGSLFLLTLIDTSKLSMATTAMVAMTTALFGGAGAMRLVDTKSAIKASIAIIGLSVALGIAALALKGVSTIDPAKTTQSLEAMAIGLGGLVISVQALSQGKGDTKLLKTIGLLLGLSVALLVLSTAILAYGYMEPAVLEQGLIGISGGLLALSAAITIVTREGGDKMISAALGITVMAAALLVLQLSVAEFGEMELPVLAQGMASMGAVLLSIALFSRKMDKADMLKAGLGIAAMAKGFKTMASAIADFAALSWGELARGLVGFGAVLLGITVALQFMQNALPGAIAMLVVSVALIAFAGAMTILAQLSWEQIKIGLVAIAAFLLILIVAGYLLTPVVFTLLLLGSALFLIGAGAALFGLGISLAAGGLALLAGSGVLIGGAIKVVGEAIIEILPRLGEAIADGLTNFLERIAENMPRIISAFKDIVLGMIGALVELIPDMVAAIMDLIVAILEAIGERLPDLIQAGYDILLAFIQGIADNIAEVVAAGLNVLTEFLAGIEEGLPALVDQAFSLILTFLEAIADAVEEYFPQIVEAGLRIGEAIVDGLVQAVSGGLEAVKNAVFALARAALEALGLGFLWSSPSKKTYEIGEGFVEGFIRAVSDGVTRTRDAMRKFAETANKGMALAVKEVDEALEYNPVIRPVLDLDNVQSGALAINRSFDNARVLAELSYEGQLASTEDYSTGVNGSSKGVTFIQNNYSPKALDRQKIYRQTRTQVAKLSERAFE